MITELNGFKINDQIVEFEHNYGRIIEFKLCKNNHQIMPVIKANNRVYFAHWDYLRKTEHLEQLNLFRPIDEADPQEPPEGEFMETQTFKAITVHPPMSEMIVRGIKDVENRPISYMGKLLIHASKTYNQEQAQWIKDNIGIEAPTPEECQIGGIVAIADIETTEESNSVWAMEDAKYYWKIKSVQPVKFFPCRGQQGLFNCEIPVDHLLLQDAQETELEKTQLFELGDWITTIFDYDLNVAHIHGQAPDKIQRLGTIIKEQSDSFLISSFPTNQPQTIVKCEAKLLPFEIVDQIFSLIPQAPLISELNELEAEPKSYLPDSYPDSFTVPQGARLELVKIAEIKQDSRTQPRDFSDNKIVEKSQKVIEDYAQQKRQGVIFDPIELIETEEGELLFATGDHRLKADILNKETKTWAIIRKGNLADAIALGALANGKQQHFNLTKREKVNQVYLLFEAFSMLSESERIERQLQGILPRNTDQEIANATGLSRSKIIDIRKKLIEEHQGDPQWEFLKGGKTLTKDGRVIDTSKIGKPKEEEPFSLPITLEEAPIIPNWLKRGMAVTVTDPEAPDTKGITTAVSAIGCPVLFPNQEAPHYILIEFLKPYLSIGDRLKLGEKEGKVVGLEIDEISPDCYVYFLIDGNDEPTVVKALDLSEIEQEPLSQQSHDTNDLDLSDSDGDVEECGQPETKEKSLTCIICTSESEDQEIEEEVLIDNYTPSQLCEIIVNHKDKFSQAQLQWLISSLLPQLNSESRSTIALEIGGQ